MSNANEFISALSHMNDSGQAAVAAEENVGNDSTTETQVMAESAAAEPDVSETDGVSNQETEETPSPEGNNDKPTEEPDFFKQYGFENEDHLKDVLDRSQRYEELEKAKQELEANQFKPANEYIATLNKLVLDGASADQLKAFREINEYGSLEDLSPEQILIAHKVLIGNYSEEVAKHKVKSEYDLTQYDEGEIEYKALQDDMRVSASKALEDLNKYKAELSVINNPEKEQAEQARLNEIAQRASFESNVDKSYKSIASAVNTKIKIEGVSDSGSIELSYPDEFKSRIPQLTKDFLLQTGYDPNDPKISQVVSDYLEVRYMSEDINAFKAAVTSRIESVIEEKYANKYATNGGLPKEEVNPAAVSNNDSLDSFYNRVATGRAS